MNRLQNHLIKVLQIISCGCILIYCVVFICYLCVFNGELSTEVKEWDLFVLIFNGIITCILAVTNIFAIITINNTIENKNAERHIKDTLYEAETILTQIRFKEYADIRNEIVDLKASLFRKEISLNSIENLKKRLMAMDDSFLYKGQELHHKTISQTFGHSLVTQIDSIKEKIKKNEKVQDMELTNLQHALSRFISILEFHIIAQLVRGEEVQTYISNNRSKIDSSISCIYEFAQKLNRLMEENDKI